MNHLQLHVTPSISHPYINYLLTSSYSFVICNTNLNPLLDATFHTFSTFPSHTAGDKINPCPLHLNNTVSHSFHVTSFIHTTSLHTCYFNSSFTNIFYIPLPSCTYLHELRTLSTTLPSRHGRAPFPNHNLMASK